MRLRGLAVLAALGGSVAVAAVFGIVGIDSPDAMDSAAGGVSVAAKVAPAEGSTPVVAPDVAPVQPVADAALIDSSLFSPRPMLGPSNPPPPLRLASLGDPVLPPEHEVTASIRHALAAPEVKRPAYTPRLEKDGTLSLEHLAGIKASLRLSPDQERYWAPVEAELREIMRQLAAQKASSKNPKVALSADVAQRLYWAAGPLIMSLREDQKEEARRLARAMGLQQVASLL